MQPSKAERPSCLGSASGASSGGVGGRGGAGGGDKPLTIGSSATISSSYKWLLHLLLTVNFLKAEKDFKLKLCSKFK